MYFAKKILFFTFIIIFSNYLFAEDVLRPEGNELSSAYQDYYIWKPPLIIGLDFGLTYNSFNHNVNTNIDNQSLKIFSEGLSYSYNLNFIIDYRLNNFLGLDLSLGFNQISFRNNGNIIDYKNSNFNEPINLDINWNKEYFNLSSQLYLRYKATNKFIFYLGSYFFSKIDANNFKLKINNNEKSEEFLILSKINNLFSDELIEKFNYGLIAGISYRFYLMNDLFFDLNFKYLFSFKEILKNSNINLVNNKFIEIYGRQSNLINVGLSLQYKL